jgi:tetratricopeptide (TPR) repeat protein
MQIARLQADLIFFVFQAFMHGTPLEQKCDIPDMIDEEMWWVLSCIYRNGIGLGKDPKRAEVYLKLSIQAEDPDAYYFKAVQKKSIALMEKAAKFGHTKAIRAMANYYMGASLFDSIRAADLERAAAYVSLGQDAMCVAQQAISAFERDGVKAEEKLRKARHYFTTPAIHRKVTLYLAQLYRKTNRHDLAFELLEPMDKDDDVWLGLGCCYSAMGFVDKAISCLEKSKCADSYVALAKIYRVQNGDNNRIEKWMRLAAKERHPKAAVYYLSEGKLSAREVKKYVAMLGECRDQSMLIQCAMDFKEKNHLKYFDLCNDMFKALRK